MKSMRERRRCVICKSVLNIVSALVMPVLLAACAAAGPDYHPPHIASPAAWHAEMIAGLTKEAVNAQAIGKWWQQFGDATLTELIERTVATNTDVRTARARLREARARRAVAGAAFFPSVTAFASGTKNSPVSGPAGRSQLYAAGFDASWEPDVFGGARRTVEAAQADLEASAATLYATQVSLIGETALNYVEMRSLQRRLEIARSNLASQAETLQLTEWRAQAGLVSSLDVEQARANLEQTRAQIPQLETTLAQARNRLAVLTGEVPGALNEKLATDGAMPAVPLQVAVGIPAETLRRRPDVRAAERRLAAETARVGQAQAARYPSFALSGSIGVDALTVGTLGSGTVTRSFAASLASTIFDAGRLAQTVVAQDAVRQQALIAYESTVLTALEDVENALVSFTKSRDRQVALRAAADAARNAALLARNRYASGVIDFQTVLDTERTVLTLEDSLVVAQSNTVSSLIQLYKALGGGWSPAAPGVQ